MYRIPWCLNIINSFIGQARKRKSGSIRPFSKQDLEAGSSVFSDFFMSKKSDEARFLKNRPYGSGVSKKSRKWPKNEVLVVLGKLKSIHIYFFFCLNLKVLNGLLAFCKNCMSGLHMTALRYEVEFLYLIRYTEKQQIYLVISVGVVRHAWACPKWYQIVSLHHPKNELN